MGILLSIVISLVIICHMFVAFNEGLPIGGDNSLYKANRVCSCKCCSGGKKQFGWGGGRRRRKRVLPPSVCRSIFQQTWSKRNVGKLKLGIQYQSLHKGLFALTNEERPESYSNKILSVVTSQYVCVAGGIIISQIISRILFKGKMRFLQK